MTSTPPEEPTGPSPAPSPAMPPTGQDLPRADSPVTPPAGSPAAPPTGSPGGPADATGPIGFPPPGAATEHPFPPQAAPGPWATPAAEFSPFQPVYRPPRAPWVNPARRSHLVGAAVVAGLVLLAAGFGIGYAAAPSGHNGPQRIERGGGYLPGQGQLRGGPGGQFPGNGQRQGPGFPRQGPTSVPATPASPATPAPSTTN
jgi:hypothetical protein